MNDANHILIVSRDPSLLQSRKLILGTLFHVDGAARVAEAEAKIARQDFGLIVLCYSLRADECQQVAALARKRIPCAKILMLSAYGTSCIEDLNDQVLVMDHGPYGLLKKVAEMLGIDLREKTSRKPVQQAAAVGLPVPPSEWAI